MKIIQTSPAKRTVVAAATEQVIAAKPNARALKITSAIEPDSKYFLVGRERFMHALYFYNNKFRKGRPEWTWVSLISQVLFPTWEQKPISKKMYKDCFTLWDKSSKLWSDLGLAAAIGVKKDLSGKKFLATVPLVAFDSGGYPEGMGSAAVAVVGPNAMSQPDWQEKVASKSSTATIQGEHSLSNLRAMGHLSALDAEQLKVCKAKLIIRPIKDATVAFLQLEFTQREVEFLTNSAFIEIRPLDFYGVIRAWVDGLYGFRQRSPSFSIPLSRIAKASDSKPSSPRLSSDRLLMDEHAVIMCLPDKINQINDYEDAASTAYSHEDGTFSALGEDGRFKNPPAAMPVYLDWVNMKFAYTSLDGKLLIQNLDRSQALTVTHIRRFLDKFVTSDQITNFLTMSNRLADFMQLDSLNTKDLYMELADINRRKGMYNDLNSTPLIALYNYSSEPNAVLCKRAVSMLAKTAKFVEENPKNAYAKYSVPTVIELLGQMKVFNLYASKYGEVVADDNKKRESYLNQGEKKDWVPDQVPFVLPDRGLMPHQAGVENKVRDNPDNAVYPVDAGGGKTSIIVFEILKNMKTMGQKLQLVMCPSHLVAQYVKEFVYFCGSQVNVIPVTTYTIRRHGLERLGKMIQNAPNNTVVVTDYNAIVYKQSIISYGVAPIRLYPIIDFLRQFPFGYVACDESHWLKNGSSRNSAASKLLIEIQKKRLASGTMVADTMIDLVRQTALMDPSIFGTIDDFIKEYALETRGSKVIEWKPGAHIAIQNVINQNIVSAGAKRKEWAAILPWPKEKFHKTSMTPAQFKCYGDILGSIREQLEKAAQENESLRKLLNGEEDSENPDINIDSMLKPYLARLERFLTAPAKDILGNEVLKGPDRVSPKVLKIIEICKEHMAEGVDGKVLIFTNYEFSAQAIYEALVDAGLKAETIYYTAGNKEECGADFEKNPKKKIMVGIEQSMNTGLNLQFCSRLIRCETVWTPGVLEQGNSRIGRPNIKDKESRPFIYYDWIITNQTIDITKVSYLMAKTISKAKFDEAGNPKFDALEVPPLFSMTLDNVFAMNDFDETLVDYFTKYAEYKKALFSDYDLYRTKYKDRLFDKDGKIKMASLERAAPPPDSAVMKLLPYVPGTELYQADKLGLVRYDAFMRLEESELEDKEGEDDGEGDDGDDILDEDEDGASADRKAALQAERDKALGLFVHTEFGDGEIIGLNAKTLKVKLPSGNVFRVRKLAAFMITRAQTSGKDIRTQLLKLNGDLPLDAPIDVPSPHIVKVKPSKKTKKGEVDTSETEEIDEEEAIEMELDFTVVNDFLGLRLVNMDNEQAVRVAQSLGFKHPPAYFAAFIRKPVLLLQTFKKWNAAGFIIDKENNEACKQTFLHFKANVTQGGNFYGLASSTNIKNFYRMEFKPNPNKMHINPYPIIQDGQLYLGLPMNGQPGSKNAISKGQVAGVRWLTYPSGSELILFTPRKDQASKIIKTILDQGIRIPNLDKLKAQFKKLRIARDVKIDE